MCADIADRITGWFSFVASQIVQDDDVAGFQGWNQALLNPCGKSDAVDGTVEHEGCDNAIAAQISQKGQRLPVNYAGPLRSEALPADTNEDKLLWIKPMLMGLPPCPEPSHLRPVLLARHQCFFDGFALRAQEQIPRSKCRDSGFALSRNDSK